jgi:hypothetical protein
MTARKNHEHGKEYVARSPSLIEEARIEILYCLTDIPRRVIPLLPLIGVVSR